MSEERFADWRRATVPLFLLIRLVAFRLAAGRSGIALFLIAVFLRPLVFLLVFVAAVLLVAAFLATVLAVFLIAAFLIFSLTIFLAPAVLPALRVLAFCGAVFFLF